MEAPKLNQLLEVAEKRNPNWYPFVYGYLKGELQNLEVEDDYNYDHDIPFTEQRQMNIGNFDGCVVGEVFGWYAKYNHDGIEGCIVCDCYAKRLFDNSNAVDNEDGSELEVEDQRDRFADLLREFYEHRGYMK